jgi:uncharacterized membrane protein
MSVEQMIIEQANFARIDRSAAAKIRSGLAGLIFLSTICATSPGSAQQITSLENPDALPIWQQTFYKTVTYQTAINLVDAALFYGLVHANGPATVGFVAVNAASAAAMYYGFEYAWQTTGAVLGPEAEPSLVAKTTVFQTLNAGRFSTVSYVFGGGLIGSATLTAAATVLDTAVFMTNEYAWGPIRPRPVP